MSEQTPSLPGYAFTHRHFQHPNGLRQHYLDEGQGPLLLMLHGNPSWSYAFRHLVNGLRGRYRCLVPDHIGMGLSDKPPASRYGYRLADRIDDLERLVATVAPETPLTLVVHDWGGMIGMGYALRHPDRIRRLVLFNTATFPKPPGKPLPLLLRLVRDTRLGAAMVLKLNFFAWGASRLGTVTPMPAPVRSAYLAPYDTPEHRIATLRFVQDIPLRPRDPGYLLLEEAEALLRRYARLPVFIGWGLRDFVFDQRILARFRELLPDAEVHAFADAGHYVLEDAQDRILPPLADFLARTGGAC